MPDVGVQVKIFSFHIRKPEATVPDAEAMEGEATAPHPTAFSHADLQEEQGQPSAKRRRLYRRCKYWVGSYRDPPRIRARYQDSATTTNDEENSESTDDQDTESSDDGDVGSEPDELAYEDDSVEAGGQERSQCVQEAGRVVVSPETWDGMVRRADRAASLETRMAELKRKADEQKGKVEGVKEDIKSAEAEMEVLKARLEHLRKKLKRETTRSNIMESFLGEDTGESSP